MEIISLSYPIEDLSERSSSDHALSLAIGYFDGVHRGHQNVIGEAVKAAKAGGMQSAVMTFHPHPREVLARGEHYFTCLTPLEEKLELFAALGVDMVYVVRFDLSFAAVTPKQFVDEVLRPLGAKQVVVGFDFTFGYQGQGTPEALRELGYPDLQVTIVEPLCDKGTKVSSTYVRQALSEGQVTLAADLLGRPYEVIGTVVHGDGRGRTIGFPTANLDLSHSYVIPRLGVYAVRVHYEGAWHYGVLNHGNKPTFKQGGVQPVMEAHLFNYDGDLYGHEVRVQFLSFLRPEQKFGSVHELIEQIGVDAATAKRQFGIE
ncbi:bifunctional riboflavin kinase/FAD synthetase [Paenibacillus sp. GCM10023252]|uniref:bifunctional riboflavin kinase/FAD synthetase n=1 Tax=Paenibacillus sp. GCM10023252 TaxID=3252649 RepID=UPI00361202CE